MNKRLDYLKSIISVMPSSSGVYQYFNKNGDIIYVGKAKNLKRRVSSYFNKEHDSIKTNILVNNIYDLKYICVNSEADALLLENNLIKKYQPRYNILLKDGKTYPWLCITKEPFPRVFKTRQVFRGADYFGPYPSSYTLDILLELIREIYPVRTCKLNILPDEIKKNKYDVCLQYHIKKCNAPCIGNQSLEEYNTFINEIREIAKGRSHIITNYLLEKMNALAAEYRFEEAQEIKNKYDSIVNYQSKTVITTTSDNDIDVFAYDEDEQSAYINMLRINGGCVVQGFTIEYKKTLDEPKEEIFALAIVELRERFKSISNQIIVPFIPDMELENAEFIVPQRGDKKKLLDLSIQNVRQYRVDKYKQAEKLNPEQRVTKILKEVQEKLYLPTLPNHIECFDNSNISGTNAVAGCVVYKKAKPSKKDYRKYIIKTVEGQDDYASMREVVYRRYSRMIEEGTTLPDLILTDGGKGHMESVRQVVEDTLHLNIPIVGLAKNDKHTTSEVLVGFPPQSIGLKPTDTLFRFLAEIQEEVHRFAITFHRDKRSKSQIASELDSIKGIGESSKKLLLKHFKSVKRISLASLEELTEVLPTSRASIIYAHFHPQKEP
ncbi:MAG: excinuclease ABC subunit UvrC [Bacteroidales bacterium]|nr:excinuclease ABC subunit UvrC [Bacteroidales bacterium]MDY5193310.1 excinuclease ABC subunit UvrC [Candidatus Aphodosoma sp.]